MALRDTPHYADDTFGLELEVICIGALAVLCVSVPRLLLSWAGLLLLGAALLAGLRAIVEGVQLGQHPARALTHVLSVGALAFVSISLPLWLLTRSSPGAAASQIISGTEQAAGSEAAPEALLEPSAVTPQPAGPLAVVQPPAPTAAPTQAGSCGQAMVRGVQALALRSAPGMSSEVVGSRPQGTVVDLLCDAPVMADGINWRRVHTDAVEGWMSAGFLR